MAEVRAQRQRAGCGTGGDRQEPQARRAHSAPDAGRAPRRGDHHSRRARPPPRRSRREFLAVPPLRVAASRRGNVDWRRSARDDHLYVREREWEASHTIWLWPDRSPSMEFHSDLTEWSKLDRALVVTFALAEVLVQGGERVGIPGVIRPTSNRNIIEKMAQAHRARHHGAAEPAAAFRAGAVLRSAVAVGLLEPDRGFPHASSASLPPTARAATSSRWSIRRKRLSRMAAASNSSSPKGSAASPPAAPKCGAPITRSSSPITAPRCAPRCERFGWTFTMHRTDRGPTECCWRSMPAWARARRSGFMPRKADGRETGATRDRRPSPRLRAAARPARPARPAGAVVAAAAGAAAPAAHRFPADPIAVRDRAQGRDAVAHAVVADAASAAARRPW